MTKPRSHERRESSDEAPEYLPIDTRGRTEPEITQLLEKHISRDDIVRYRKIKIDKRNNEVEEIVFRTEEERVAYIVQSTLIALEITPNTPDLFENPEGWQLDPTQRANAQHALEVEKAVKAAREVLADAQMRLSKIDFGDFMMDVLDDVQRHKADTDLYRAFRILQTMSIDRNDLVLAHRVALTMLHQKI